MKRLTLLVGLIFGVFSSNIFAQQNEKCGFDSWYQEQWDNNPEFRKNVTELNQKWVQFKESGAQFKTNATYKIPVVFHIVHNGGSENISKTQIESQIQILNSAYGNTSGVNLDIDFFLATIDPNGECTDGITRTQSTLADHDKSQESSLKNLVRWPTDKYLNIWVTRTLTSGANNLLGYATFPGGSTSLDGVVLLHSATGTTGTASFPSEGGNTAVHEVGHWLNLYHPFQGGCTGTSAATCASQGDLCCDTPPMSQAIYGCNTQGSINSCTETPTDLPDDLELYMGYQNDACIDHFTNDQKDRAILAMTNDALRISVSSGSNLTATGYGGNTLTPVVDFSTTNSNIVPEGSAVVFSDKSTCVDSWSWALPGASATSSTSQNPFVFYNTAGQYDVTLDATNTNGTSQKAIPGYIIVLGPTATNTSISLEDFESTFPTDYILDNIDGGLKWEIFNGASASTGNQCLRLNTFDNPIVSYDGVLLPNLNLSSSSVSFSFKYAYQQYDITKDEYMRVMVSTNQGSSWTTVWEKNKFTLPTKSGSNSSTGFVPAGTSEWSSADIDLSSYAGNSNVWIMIQGETENGQNMYLDDIETKTVVNDVLIESISNVNVHPNPFEENVTVDFNLLQNSEVSIKLSDITGKVIFSNQYPLNAGNQSVKLKDAKISSLAKGVYFLKISDKNGTKTKKLVKN